MSLLVNRIERLVVSLEMYLGSRLRLKAIIQDIDFFNHIPSYSVILKEVEQTPVVVERTQGIAECEIAKVGEIL